MHRYLFLILVSIAFIPQVNALGEKDTLYEDSYKVLYKLDLFRAFQGTIQFSTEWEMSNKHTISLGLMGTYASTRGLAKPYLEAQEFSYTDENHFSYNLDNVEARGYGINFQLRKYNSKTEKYSGYYISPEVFFRQLFLTSEVYDYQTQTKEIKRNLYLGYLGYMLGYQRTIRNVVCIDTYIGGGFFYSKYADEPSNTKYRNTYQIDFTGFYLNTGILIGITK